MEYRVLGPLQVIEDDREIAIGSPKEQALLAILLLHARAVVSRERLIDELWGDSPPPTAAKALNVHVSQLRKTLAQNGDATIATRAPGYVIEIEPDRLDAERFERLVATARERLRDGDVEAARGLLADALGLWRGPALDGVELEAAARAEAARLDELRVVALMERIDCDLALGLHEPLVGELEALVAEHPLRERLRGQLMLALYRSGRQADALRVYRQARETLVDELGIEPGAALQQLERAILNQDRALDVPPPPARAEPTRRAAARPRLRALTAVALLLVAALVTVAVVVTHGSRPAVAAIRPDSIAAFDPSRRGAVADIPLHTRPAAIAFGDGSLWVATKDDRTLLQIDPDSRRLTRTIGLAAVPTTIVADGRYVWLVYARAQTLVQLDGDTGTVVRKVGLGGTVAAGRFKGRSLRLLQPAAPFDFHFAAGDGAAWVAYGEDVVARVDAETGAVTQIAAGSELGIAAGAGGVWSIGGSADGERAGTVFRIDARTGSVDRIASGVAAYGIEAGPYGVWANGIGQTWEIDPDTLRVVVMLPLHHPIAVGAVGAGGVWLANADGTLSHIDTKTASVVRTIQLGRYPRLAYPVGLTTGDGLAWVAVH